MIKKLISFVLPVLLLTATGAARAQSTTEGAIAGTVEDSTSAAVPNAAITIRNDGTNAVSYTHLGDEPGAQLRSGPQTDRRARGNMDIQQLRNKIDQLDDQLVRLLSERAAAAAAIGELKAKQGTPIYEPQREQDVINHVRGANPGPLTDLQVQHVLSLIHI